MIVFNAEDLAEEHEDLPQELQELVGRMAPAGMCGIVCARVVTVAGSVFKS